MVWDTDFGEAKVFPDKVIPAYVCHPDLKDSKRPSYIRSQF